MEEEAYYIQPLWIVMRSSEELTGHELSSYLGEPVDVYRTSKEARGFIKDRIAIIQSKYGPDNVIVQWDDNEEAVEFWTDEQTPSLLGSYRTRYWMIYKTVELPLTNG